VIGIAAAIVLFVLAFLRHRGRAWDYAFHGTYLIFLVYAVLAIPSRTGFQLAWPACEMVPTVEGAIQALAKVPHILLFGVFFVTTAGQFPKNWRYRFPIAMLVTVLFGLVIEIEEGATVTGNCRMRDLLPDTLGGLLGIGVIMIWERFYPRIFRKEISD